MLRIGSIVRHHRWRMRNSADSGHTFRSKDADGNEYVKKIIGFISKTTTLHVYHDFLYIVFARFCTTTTWKCLISHFMEDVNKQRLTLIFLFVLGVLRVYSSCTSPYISYAIGEKFVCNSKHLLPLAVIISFQYHRDLCLLNWQCPKLAAVHARCIKKVKYFKVGKGNEKRYRLSRRKRSTEWSLNYILVKNIIKFPLHPPSQAPPTPTPTNNCSSFQH